MTLINFLHKKNNKSKSENQIPKYKDLITTYEHDFNTNFKNRFQTHYNKVKQQIKNLVRKNKIQFLAYTLCQNL